MSVKVGARVNCCTNACSIYERTLLTLLFMIHEIKVEKCGVKEISNKLFAHS